MTKRFIEEEKDVFRLKIPFETVHTSGLASAISWRTGWESGFNRKRIEFLP